MRTILMTAAVLLVAYSAFVAYGPRPAEARLQSQWQENSYVMEKYFRLSVSPSVVVVGSSLTKRLDFKGSAHCVYNLALSAGSALSGLRAIARGAAMPTLVLVEINVPDRGADDSLVAESSGILPRHIPALATENIPANLFYGLLSELKRGGAAASRQTDAGLAGEALERELQRQLERYRETIPAKLLQRHIAEFRSAISELERRSIEVVLFEIPIHPRLEASPRAAQIRGEFRKQFAGHRLLGYDELAGDTAMKTRDALHLTEDEAAVVVARMQSLLSVTCPNGR